MSDTPPPFKMNLTGARTVIDKTAIKLRERFGATVIVTGKGARWRLAAMVPQEHARAAMAVLGLP